MSDSTHSVDPSQAMSGLVVLCSDMCILYVLMPCCQEHDVKFHLSPGSSTTKYLTGLGFVAIKLD
uniref:Ovule protein n=1 Tax=Loa loa TaxID=7209 RepID=A0A1I7VPW6_LOALO